MAVSGCGSAGGLPVDRVAKRVEQIRGLRLSHLPRVRVVGQAALLAVLNRLLPPRLVGPGASDFVGRVSVAEVPVIERLEALELLGTVPEGTTIGQMFFGASTDPGGLFDARSNTVYVRQGARSGELDVLAHELTHALEFQHGLHSPRPAGTSSFDGLEADRALIEGSATVVQYLYATRYLGFRGDLRAFVDQLRANALREVHLPRLLLAQALFPYTDGALFVDRVRRTGGWVGVTALERDPPPTTQTILGVKARRAVVPPIDTRGILAPAWRPLPLAPIGDLDTALLLSPGALDAPAPLTRSWRGGSLQLWQNLLAAHVQRCQRPCAGHYTLIARWAWTSPAAASLAAEDLRHSLAKILVAPPGGSGHPILRTRLGSDASITSTGNTTTVVLSPNAALTAALTARNQRLPQ